MGLYVVPVKKLSCVLDAIVYLSYLRRLNKWERDKGKSLTEGASEATGSTIYYSVSPAPPLKTRFCKLKGGDAKRAPEISVQGWLKRKRGGRHIMTLFKMMIQEKVN